MSKCVLTSHLDRAVISRKLNLDTPSDKRFGHNATYTRKEHAKPSLSNPMHLSMRRIYLPPLPIEEKSSTAKEIHILRKSYCSS